MQNIRLVTGGGPYFGKEHLTSENAVAVDIFMEF